MVEIGLNTERLSEIGETNARVSKELSQRIGELNRLAEDTLFHVSCLKLPEQPSQTEADMAAVV